MSHRTEGYNAFIARKEIRRSGAGRLSSLRVGIKDNIDIGGMPTTAASRILRDNMARSDAPLVERLLADGALIVGKTNMHEFAIGATTTSTAAGPCLNPHDTSRICGGSSGGSAACVAAGEADIGIGTDTGGSVRLPAAFCGVIGFKPTTGAISAEGVVPLSTTLDSVGILGREMESIGLVFRTLCEPAKSLRAWSPSGRVRLGLLMFGEDAVSRELMHVVDGLRKCFDISVASMPLLTGEGARIRRIVSSYEAARYHEKWMKDRSGEYFPDVLSVLRSGSDITDDQYAGGKEELMALREDFGESMKDFDALLSPTVTAVAPRISDVLGHEAEYRSLLAETELFNATGSPSLSLPVASVDGLPAGLMVSGVQGDDMKILAIGDELMRVSGK